MKGRNYIRIFVMMVAVVSMTACKKYLGEKPDKKLVIPSSLQDLQGLLDNYTAVSQSESNAGSVSDDDYYVTTADWSSLSNEYNRRMYSWEPDNLFAAGFNDWAYIYANVYSANTVLENIDKVERTAGNQNAWDDLKGQALFLRARAFLQAVLVWSQAYDETSASTDLGIPLRLSTDFNVPSVRSSVRDSYDRIILDAEEAGELLALTPLQVVRSSKPAAYALLARTYLAMRRYDSCGKYANLCLQLKNNLMDYNSDPAINQNGTFAMTRFNPEVILDLQMSTPSILSNTKAKIDSFLYQSYAADDKRKALFFKNNSSGSVGFRGSYSGTGNLFEGIATDEVILMRSECYARTGNKDAALADLNNLLIKRWNNTVPYPFITAADAAEALNKVLIERRKELLMRNLRWMDIKRLNKEGANILLKRIVNGQVYTLLPNDKKYALPVPEDVIALSGMIQNPR